MTDMELILSKLDAMHKDIGELKEQMAELAEAHEETRTGVNSLLEWAEACANAIKFPLPRI